MYDAEGNYTGPPVVDEEAERRTAAERLAEGKAEKKRLMAKRKREEREAELTRAALAPELVVTLQSPFAKSAAAAVKGGEGGTNTWWAHRSDALPKAEKEIPKIGEEERRDERMEEMVPKVAPPTATATTPAAEPTEEATKELGLWEKTNLEKQHLARQPKPKRDRAVLSKNRDDLGHFHKQDYYIPKGRADNFSGMFVAKETGEML